MHVPNLIVKKKNWNVINENERSKENRIEIIDKIR